MEFDRLFDDGVECETQISHYGKVLGGMDTLNSWNKSLSVVLQLLTIKYFVNSLL